MMYRVKMLILAGVVLSSISGMSPLALAETANELLAQAEAAAARDDSTAAIRLATTALNADMSLASGYYLRGREHFRIGKFKESVTDFDRFVELRPAGASRQWERGIACYYAKQFEQGAKQFELYQTYHDNDVENAVWRYLCMVPLHGVERARAVMLPIENDRRVPMMQIYELYRGNLTPDEVWNACTRDTPAPEILAGRQFYAHLYLGLYHEVAGAREMAERHIRLAADDKYQQHPGINGYMWSVARIHAQAFGKEKEQ